MLTMYKYAVGAQQLPLPFCSGDRYAKQMSQKLSDIQDHVPQKSQSQDFRVCVFNNRSVWTFVLR